MGTIDTVKLSNLYSKVITEQFYNKTLNKSFWQDDAFDQEVRENLLSIAKDFYKHLKLDVPVLDIQLTGSLANYNYSGYSDLDVHVIIDFSKINRDIELVKRALDGARFVWNMRHNIVIKGHDVELYVQDVHEQHTASGLFSLLNNEWIKKPTYNPPQIDERDVEVKYQYYVKEIDKMVDLLNNELAPAEYKAISRRAERLKEKIQQDRKECLSKEGEFCIENLVFKKLRNTGEIEKLIDIATKAYDSMYSDLK